MREKESIVYGVNPVYELLRAKRRRIKRLYLMSNSKSPSIKKIQRLARENGVEIEYVPREAISNLVRSSEHQGVAAICDPIELYSYRYFIENYADYDKILILNNIQDPHNLGAVIRSAYLFSFRGIVLTEKNTASITPAVIKASSGAIEYVTISIEDNLPQVIIDLKRAHYKVVALDISGDVRVDEIEIDPPVAIIVGGEDAGINAKLLRLSDYKVRIPVCDDSLSLNLSVSAAIMMYELSNRK